MSTNRTYILTAWLLVHSITRKVDSRTVFEHTLSPPIHPISILELNATHLSCYQLCDVWNYKNYKLQWGATKLTATYKPYHEYKSSVKKVLAPRLPPTTDKNHEK